jgi:ATP-dependent exoDNAse (exonuclease V) beta subunit
LHLVAQVKVGETKSGEKALAMPPKGTLLARLWPALRLDLERDWAAREQESSVAIAAAHAAADPMQYPLRRLASGWSLSAPSPSVPWQPLEREEEARETIVEFSWAGETARHVGTVVHAFLQRIADEGLARWNARRIEKLDQVLRLALRQEGVPEHELNNAHARVVRALQSVLADPRARWILRSDHADARTEYRLTGEIDNVFVNIVLDRTFVDSDGVRWIVDYKTGIHEGADIERFLDNERERYRDQLERYAAILARSESRPIRLALYYPLIRGWREWEPAPVARRR